MCVFDTRTLGEGFLDPVFAVLHASHVVPLSTKKEINRVLWTTSLEDVIEIFYLPPCVAREMRAAHATLSVPDHIETFGDENLLADILMPRFLVTSGYERLQAKKIQLLKIKHLFAEVVIDTIDDLGTRQGKKKIFEDIRTRYGWKPEEVVVVGDNPLSELKAGKELGMRTIQTLRPTIVRAEGFDGYISTFEELPAFLSP